MTLPEFQEIAIDRGIAASRLSYSRPDQKRQRDGARAGFMACRGKSPQELRLLLDAAEIATADAWRESRPDTWWYICYAAEVGWICNVISVELMRQGLPTIVPPTCRAALFAASIVGVKEAT